MKHKPPVNVWVVVPAHNEAAYIETVLRKIGAITKQIVVVDDGSRDETVTLAKKLSKNVLVHPVNLGKGAALKTGCDFAFNYLGAEAVVVMDSDDQHDPALLPTFMEKLSQSPVIFGVRDFSTMPWMRTLGNRMGSVLIWLLFGRYLHDIPSGYKGFSKEAYQHLRWHSLGYSVEMEIAARVAKFGLPVEQVAIPTIYHDFSRGMTVLDTITMIGYVLAWRISL